MLGLPGVDVAVAAGAGAGLAEDLKGRGAAAPALGDVRAARLLADRVQARAVDERLHVEVARVGARRAHLHPFRPARPLSDWQRPAQFLAPPRLALPQSAWRRPARGSAAATTPRPAPPAARSSQARRPR